MKTTKMLLMLLVVTMSFNACKKDDDKDDKNVSTDLTTTIVGLYKDAETLINVTKVDDSHVSISVSPGNIVFNNVKMNTLTSFTANSFTTTQANCQRVFTSNGTCSATNIALTINVDATALPGSGFCIDELLIFNGIRQ